MSTGNGQNGKSAFKPGTSTEVLERVASTFKRQPTRPAEDAIAGNLGSGSSASLPLNNEQQALAIEKFVEYLQAHAESDDLRVEGFTMSDPLAPPWAGYWYSADERQWIEDRIVLCMIDFRLRNGRTSTPRCMLEIKRVVAGLYRNYA